MNIDRIEQLEQALKYGHKVRNVRYNQDEWLQLVDGVLVDELGVIRGSLTDDWWRIHVAVLPTRWHIFEPKDKP